MRTASTFLKYVLSGSNCMRDRSYLHIMAYAKCTLQNSPHLSAFEFLVWTYSLSILLMTLFDLLVLHWCSDVLDSRNKILWFVCVIVANHPAARKSSSRILPDDDRQHGFGMQNTNWECKPDTNPPKQPPFKLSVRSCLCGESSKSLSQFDEMAEELQVDKNYTRVSLHVLTPDVCLLLSCPTGENKNLSS